MSGGARAEGDPSASAAASALAAAAAGLGLDATPDGEAVLLTDDPGLPEALRVRVTRSGDDLTAARALGPVRGLTPDLARALDAVNRALPLGRVVVADGAASLEVTVPAPGGAVDPEQLRVAFLGAVAWARAHRPTLAPHGLGDPMAARRGGPRSATGVARRPAQDDAQTVALPPSYLPGSGQGAGESATRRYGAADALPGRPELAPAERRRPPRPRGGAGPAIAGVLLLAAVAVGGVAWSLRRPPGSEPVADAGPRPDAVPGAPAGPTGGDGAAAPAPDAGGWAQAPLPGGAAPGADTSPPPGGERPPPTGAGGARPAPLDEAAALALARAQGRRAEAVERWRAAGLDAAPGARARMLEALDGAQGESAALRELLASVRERPLDLEEAAACLPRADEALFRVLVEQLAAAPPGPAAERAARALEAQLDRDTSDKAVLEAVVRLAGPRPGALEALLRARGPEWLLYGDGGPLCEALAARDVAALAPLLAVDASEVRAHACGLVARAGQPAKAIALLAPLLEDADAALRRTVAEALRELGDAQATAPLARALAREEDGYTRGVVRDALQRLPAREVVQQLGRLLARPAADDRLAAVAALEALGKPDAVSGLVRALDDAERDVRLAALKALEASSRQPALRQGVLEGLARIRALGLDPKDKEAYALARRLHYALTQRMPDQTR